MKTIKHKTFLIKNPETGEFESVLALRGESAYEAAVRLGYTTLTEDQWIKEYEYKRDQAIAAIDAKQETADAAAQTAIQNIETKGRNTLATIPEDYTALSNQVEEHELEISGKAPAYVATMEGVVCRTSTAQDMPLQGLRLFGKTIQDGTPTPENPVPLASAASKGNINVFARGKNLLKNIATSGAWSGITFTVNEDGSVYLTGTATQLFSLTIAGTDFIPVGDYQLLPARGGAGNRAYVDVIAGAQQVVQGDVSKVRPFTIKEGDKPYARIIVPEGETIDATFYPAIYHASVTDLTFEPCHDGGSLTVSTPNGLSGIPVANNGNYIDKDGQQWICDEIDFDRGVYVQRIKRVVIDGAGTSWGIETKSNGSGEAVNRIWYRASDADLQYGRNTMQATSFIAKSAVDYGLCLLSVDGYAVMHLNKAMKNFDKSQVQTWLAENPVTIQYIITTPIETKLSADELEAYRSMHSINRDTFVLNDADVWMEVDYADDIRPVRYDAPQILSDVQKAQALGNIGASPVVVETLEGEVVTTDIASYMPLQGLRLFGKTTQAGTPSPDSPVPLVNAGAGGAIQVHARGKNLLKNVLQKHTHGGVDITVGADGSLIANGTASAAYNTPQLYAGIASPGSYVLSHGAEYNDSCRLIVKVVRSNGEPEYAGVRNEYKITLAQGDYIETIYIGVLADAVLTNYTMYPMLRLDTEDSVFEPWHDGGSVTISAPNGLPGIPVTSGGNYTDASGQQWISDEIDLGRGVYIKHVPFVDASTLGFVASSTAGVFSAPLPYKATATGYGDNPSAVLMCDTLPALPRIDVAEGKQQGVTLSGPHMFLCLDGITTTDKLAAWFAANPTKIIYRPATPISEETPLSAEVIAAYKAMHSTKPNTTVYNDAGAWQHVDCAADAKLYIDKKFNELQSAILSQGANV